MAVLVVIVLFALAPFLVLLAFIGWDRRRLANEKVEPMSRETLRNGWRAAPVSNAPIFAGLAVVSFSLGASEWISPDLPPYHGRLSWAYRIAYTSFGMHGKAYVLWAVGVLLLVIALLSRKVES